MFQKISTIMLLNYLKQKQKIIIHSQIKKKKFHFKKTQKKRWTKFLTFFSFFVEIYLKNNNNICRQRKKNIMVENAIGYAKFYDCKEDFVHAWKNGYLFPRQFQHCVSPLYEIKKQSSINIKLGQFETADGIPCLEGKSFGRTFVSGFEYSYEQFLIRYRTQHGDYDWKHIPLNICKTKLEAFGTN